ncbi:MULTISPECIES: hypothetical protein [Cloacibacillus]|uniref:hypothetical protein n=1 Tax=Cloacibacillus TaxID=508459 RepID=UPI00210A0554|nr:MULTISPECIES: hypothetical protein [Cloacibacillus]MCQ4764799.1 hypothetical protein [Cloacibacillus evryensis]
METMAQIAQSEAFYHIAAPNLEVIYAAFSAGIAGLAYVAYRSFRIAFERSQKDGDRG